MLEIKKQMELDEALKDLLKKAQKFSRAKSVIKAKPPMEKTSIHIQDQV